MSNKINFTQLLLFKIKEIDKDFKFVSNETLIWSDIIKFLASDEAKEKLGISFSYVEKTSGGKTTNNGKPKWARTALIKSALEKYQIQNSLENLEEFAKFLIKKTRLRF